MKYKQLAPLLTALALASTASAQTTNFWTGTIGATNQWSNTTSWSNGVVPNTAGAIVTFQGDFGATATGVNIGTGENFTVGVINMTDTATGSAGKFNIASGTGGILTLDNGASVPVINYTTGGQFDNFINVILAGTNGLQKIGGGVAQLRGFNNTYSGTTIISAGGLRIDRNLSLGNATNAVNLAGGRLNLATGTVNLTNRAVSVTAGTSANPSQIQTEGTSTLEISGSLTSTAGTYFRKTDTGTLVLSGTANTVGRLEFNGGTANITGSFTNNEGIVIAKTNGAASSSTVNWSGTGTVATGNGAVLLLNDGGTAVTNSTLNVTAGTLNVGDGVNGGRFIVGGKGVGVANVTGGTLSVKANKEVSIGSFFQYGGSNGNGTLTVASGGLLQALGAGNFFVGYGQDGATAGGAFGGTGVLNLNTGGTLETGRNITTGTNATGTINFDGGTLKAAANNANLLRTTNNRVGNGGLTVDTAGFDIGISQALTANGSGGLTKTGEGTLSLGGAHTYTGPTLISDGTLKLELNSSIASAVTVGASGAIGGAGTIASTLAFESGAKFVFSLTETLSVNGASVTFNSFGIDDLIGLDSTVANGIYTIINGSAVINAAGLSNLGETNAFDLGGGKSAYFTEGSLVVNVVPEPGTYALLALAAAGFGAHVLRRRIRH